MQTSGRETLNPSYQRARGGRWELRCLPVWLRCNRERVESGREAGALGVLAD